MRAVIMRDEKLAVSRERRRGRDRVLLPGGRVRDRESITDTLVREVAEETGLDVVPQRLLYIAEVVGGFGVHDINLVWLAELRDPDATMDEGLFVAFDSSPARSMMPPIIDQIAADAAKGWPEYPMWLGNVRRPPRPDPPALPGA